MILGSLRGKNTNERTKQEYTTSSAQKQKKARELWHGIAKRYQAAR